MFNALISITVILYKHIPIVIFFFFFLTHSVGILQRITVYTNFLKINFFFFFYVIFSSYYIIIINTSYNLETDYQLLYYRYNHIEKMSKYSRTQLCFRFSTKIWHSNTIRLSRLIDVVCRLKFIYQRFFFFLYNIYYMVAIPDDKSLLSVNLFCSLCSDAYFILYRRVSTDFCTL